MAGPPPRRRKDAPAEAAPTPAKKREKTPKPRLTKGQKTAERERRRQELRAHRAGVRAIWRERWLRFSAWLWPEHTRDVGRPLALTLLVLNIAPLPGLGTMIYGRWERGALQFVLTFLFLIGWVWAIADGLRIVHRAFAGPDPRRPQTASRGGP